MDDKITHVLDIFHDRIAAEQRERESNPGGNLADRDQRLLAVGPETGRLINIIARSLKAPYILEIGTSYGYSAIWLGHAARASGGRLTTLELQAAKSAHAREMAEQAGLADVIDFRVGDALALIDALPAGIDFVLLDLWKDLYVPCLEAFLPKLNPGAIIVADNILHPGGEAVRHYVEVVRATPGIRSLLLPVGSGLEISRLDP